MLCWEWVCVKQRRYCFVAIYPLAARNCLFTGVSVHDTVFDFSHQLIHRWPRERSSAIRNLRPARLPLLPFLSIWNKGLKECGLYSMDLLRAVIFGIHLSCWRILAWPYNWAFHCHVSLSRIAADLPHPMPARSRLGRFKIAFSASFGVVRRAH